MVPGVAQEEAVVDGGAGVVAVLGVDHVARGVGLGQRVEVGARMALHRDGARAGDARVGEDRGRLEGEVPLGGVLGSGGSDHGAGLEAEIGELVGFGHVGVDDRRVDRDAVLFFGLGVGVRVGIRVGVRIAVRVGSGEVGSAAREAGGKEARERELGGRMIQGQSHNDHRISM
ncbi:hypothetical protein D3C87_1264300 [compost metagenome]